MAAEKSTAPSEPAVPEFTESDKKTARAWFKKAAELREKQNYDYAIECFISGLGFWPEAVDEGHRPLYSTAVQRQQTGGKGPGAIERMKKSITGKDHLKAMLNAESLLAKDRTNATYLDAVMKNAAKGGYFETLEWITPLVWESLRKDKKPNTSRFKTFRNTLVEAAEWASKSKQTAPFAARFFEQAVNSLDYLLSRNPSDEMLKDEQRDLSGRLTIARGRYADSESFQESIRDAGAQKLLHDAERVKQGEETLEALIKAARAEYEQEPTSTAKINALVDALLRTERKAEEDQAIEVLAQAFKDTQTYSFKSRADDIKLRQMRRIVRQLIAKAKETGAEEDRQKAELGRQKYNEAQAKVYRERVEKYPTDLRMKFQLGRAMFEARQFDEAIPMLQAAQGEPRSRMQARLLLGRAFFEVGAFNQARDVLLETIEMHEQSGDELDKELTYWLGRACEAGDEPAAAREHYGRLLRIDYNYADGDARRRLEALPKA